MINVEHEPDETFLQNLRSTLENWIQVQHLDEWTMSIGRPFPLCKMAESRKSAKEAMSYVFLYPERRVLDFSMAENRTDQYYYPKNMENKLLSCISAHDQETAQAVLDALFEENTQKRQMSVQGVKLFLYALLNTAYQIELRSGGETLPLFAASPAAQITSCLNIEEARNQIGFIFSTLCNSEEEKSSASEPSWRAQQVLDYIKAHYPDASLSLDLVAEHFHITPQYLSMLFKKNVSENFSSYVQRLRLDHAKALMEDHNLTLSVIAQRSGFNNYLALARVFQKFDNLFPGAYREQYCSKKKGTVAK